MNLLEQLKDPVFLVFSRLCSEDEAEHGHQEAKNIENEDYEGGVVGAGNKIRVQGEKTEGLGTVGNTARNLKKK